MKQECLKFNIKTKVSVENVALVRNLTHEFCWGFNASPEYSNRSKYHRLTIDHPDSISTFYSEKYVFFHLEPVLLNDDGDVIPRSEGGDAFFYIQLLAMNTNCLIKT